MTNLIKRMTIGLAVALIFIVGALWIVLSSPVAREIRVQFTAERLTDVIGQKVIIEGDAYVSLLPSPEVIITEVRLPSENIPDADLATLDLVRFTTPQAYLLGYGVVMSEIEARGLVIKLLRDKDGNTTWAEDNSDQKPKGQSEGTSERTDIIGFLGERDVVFTDMEVDVDNEKTGFEFDFDLTKFEINQSPHEEGKKAGVYYQGEINDQKAEFTGHFPDGAPFEAAGHLGALRFKLNGQKPPDRPRGDFDGEIELISGDLQNLLDSLRLTGTAEGTAEAKAMIQRTNGLVDLDDIDLELKRADGRVARLTGRAKDFGTASDFDLELFVDLVGDNPPPPPAIFVKDIRPKSLEMRIIGLNGDIEIDRLGFETNAFEEDLQDIGPFRVKSVSRTPDGRVQLLGLTLVIGPEDAPYLTGETNVGDLLHLKDYRLYGELNLPAKFVLLTLEPEEAAKFGRFTGSLKIEGVDGKANLSKLELQSSDTDLWHADIDMTGDTVWDLDGVTLTAKVGTRDGQLLLDSLQLDPIDINFVGLNIDSSLANNRLETTIDLRANDSILNNLITLHFENGTPIFRGSISSQRIQIDDFEKAIQYAAEISRLRSRYAELTTEADDFQPLVLPDKNKNSVTDDDLSDYQPLVLPNAPTEAPPEDADGFEPLVISDSAGDMAIADVLNADNFLRLADVEIGVEIERIEGQQGITNLSSSLELKKGKAQAGPINFKYGGGQTSFTAAANFIDSPDRLRLFGNTGGWDFGKALQAVGVNVGANGILAGTFDLSGRRGSLREFVYSMNGNANIDLRDGRISTALIELAGLGVLPWLFSQERQQGFSDIVCIKAPLQMTNGKISTENSVLETRQVQLVGSGFVDLNKEQISIRAEPRPVGKPLSRSAWPFEVTGSFDAPNVKIAERSRRTAKEQVEMPQDRVPCIPDSAQLRPQGNNN